MYNELLSFRGDRQWSIPNWIFLPVLIIEYLSILHEQVYFLFHSRDACPLYVE